MQRDDRSSAMSAPQTQTDADQNTIKDAGSTAQDKSGHLKHVDTPTLADEEIEHVREKSESGNALDPLALDDPTGTSVESIVLRVGITVVLIIVVGVLFAQVACKNMQLSSIPNFADGTTEESVATAIDKGIMWGGEIVRFPSQTEVNSLDSENGVLTITITDTSSTSVEQALSSAQAPAMALAMNTFEDPTIQTVITIVEGYIDEETGQLSSRHSETIGQILSITWTRDITDTSTYSCVVNGYDPFAVAQEDQEES